MDKRRQTKGKIRAKVVLWSIALAMIAAVMVTPFSQAATIDDWQNQLNNKNKQKEQLQEEIDQSKPLTVFHPIETWKKTTFEKYRLRELLVPIILGGVTVYEFPTLKEVAAYAKSEMDSFWDEYLRIDQPHIYKVDLSDKLYALKTGMIGEIKDKKRS